MTLFAGLTVGDVNTIMKATGDAETRNARFTQSMEIENKEPEYSGASYAAGAIAGYSIASLMMQKRLPNPPPIHHGSVALGSMFSAGMNDLFDMARDFSKSRIDRMFDWKAQGRYRYRM